MTPPPAAATLPAPGVAPGRNRRAVPARPARPVRPARPSRPAAVPRRVSGPARRAPAARVLPDRRLADRLLDRLIGGRAWIAVIAFALIGIVAMQLWVVKLGVGIGRALEHTQMLQRENATLAGENSSLSSAERIERLSLAKGMVFASPGELHFERAGGSLAVRQAAGALAQPIQSPTALAEGSETALAPSTGAETAPAGSTGTAAGSVEASAPASTEAQAPTSAEASPAPTSTSASASTSETSVSTPTSETQSASAATEPSTPPASAPTAGSAAAGGSPETSGGGTQVPGG